MSAVPQTKSPILSISNIEVIYDHVILVLRGVSLEVQEGQIVALLGANGAEHEDHVVVDDLDVVDGEMGLGCHGGENENGRPEAAVGVRRSAISPSSSRAG